jgi:hypothetical protein
MEIALYELLHLGLNGVWDVGWFGLGRLLWAGTLEFGYGERLGSDCHRRMVVTTVGLSSCGKLIRQPLYPG